MAQVQFKLEISSYERGVILESIQGDLENEEVAKGVILGLNSIGKRLKISHILLTKKMGERQQLEDIGF